MEEAGPHLEPGMRLLRLSVGVHIHLPMEEDILQVAGTLGQLGVVVRLGADRLHHRVEGMGHHWEEDTLDQKAFGTVVLLRVDMHHPLARVDTLLMLPDTLSPEHLRGNSRP